MASANFDNCTKMAKSLGREDYGASQKTTVNLFDDNLYLRGPINQDMLDQFNGMNLREAKTVILESGGGYGTVAKQIAQKIRGLGLKTLIRSGDECMSACTLLFQAGVKREMGANAMLGYHGAGSDDSDPKVRAQVSFRKIMDRQKLTKKSLADENLEATLAFAKELQDYGLSRAGGNFVRFTPGSRMHCITAREAKNVGAATEIVGTIVARPAVAAVPSSASARDNGILADIPNEPGTFNAGPARAGR